MENPYAAGELTPALVEEESRRPKLSSGLLMAYAVHHVFSVFGMVVGVLAKPISCQVIFPIDKPLTALFHLVLIPALDLFVVVEAPLTHFAGFGGTLPIWSWLRIPLTLTIPLSGFMYAKSRRREWLWYLAIASFGIFLSYVLRP